MGDYQRYPTYDINDETPSTSNTNKGWRRLFQGDGSIGNSSNNTHHRRRSLSVGRSSSVSKRTSQQQQYDPPSTPTLQQQQSNAHPSSAPTNVQIINNIDGAAVSNIEMPTIHDSMNSRNSTFSTNNNIILPQRNMSSNNASLLNSDNPQNPQQHRKTNSLGYIDNLVESVIYQSPTKNDIENPQLVGKELPTTVKPSESNMTSTSETVDNSIISAGNTSASYTTNTLRSRMSKASRKSNNKSRKIRKRTSTKEFIEEKLDTYSGVFLPCLAQIVGVIFFLRLPTITGQAGTIGATLIILCCVFSTFLTSLSLSAIASNGTIQAGGPYYIISRTLGVEIGGALGILFYLGTTLGASMHVMGAIETLAHRKRGAYVQNNNMHLVLSIVESIPSQVWCLLLMLIIARIVSVGSKYVTKAANFFLITVGLSIVSILLGTIFFAFGIYDGSLSDDERAFNDNLYSNYRPDPKTGVTPTFWGLVAIFYPATTGIMAGTNRSSKLATPNKSIPIGTISAICVTTILYICQVWLLGSVVSNEVLIYNKLVLTTVAFPSRIMAKVGMVTSCIGAALQCMAGAPQLLGAIAADDAIPFLKFLTRKKRKKGDRSGQTSPRSPVSDAGSLLGLAGLGESTSIDRGGDTASMASEKSEDIEFENSKRAVWFTWAIASLGTLLGNIDHITPILTMFYLMMYGGINLCCFLLAWVDSPGFRPQFKYFSQKTALLGFIWCFVLSFLISWLMALLAILLLFTIFKYIDLSATRQQMSFPNNDNAKSKSGTNWGDVFDSVKYKITMAVMAGVTGTENFHAKNWRPQLLTLVDTDEEGTPLSQEVLALAAQFRGGRGLNIVVSIKHGSYLRKGTFEISQRCSEKLKKFMEKERLQGFCEVILTLSNYEEAVWAAVMHSGLGPVSPNTVLMSWMSDWRRRSNQEDSFSDESSKNSSENENIHARSADEFVDTLKGLGNIQRAVCILKGHRFPRCGDIMPKGSTIDIYWIVDDGGLCLLLSYIISRNSIWRRNARLRVFAVTTTPEDSHRDVELSVVEFLQMIRINASVNIVSMEDTDLSDDFRSIAFGGLCPSGAPTLTIGEKFRALKDDVMSTASSMSGGGQVFPSFMPLGDKACLPTNTKLTNAPNNDKMAHHGIRNAWSTNIVPENSVLLDPSQQFLQLETAKKFNNIIRRNSSLASLVVTHLPIPHKVSKSNDFMEYVDTMFKDVDNMLLIQGTGVEYLTTVA